MAIPHMHDSLQFAVGAGQAALSRPLAFANCSESCR
jgi:hypothetical protein